MLRILVKCIIKFLFRVLLAEAYANISMTMLYYGDENGRIGAHFPFNFDFITTLSAESSARDFAYVIRHWLTYMPKGQVPNWVVSYILILSN